MNNLMTSLYHHFETLQGTRVKLRATAPEWCIDVVRTAHHGLLPDDYCYQWCMQGAAHLEEYDNAEDMKEAVPAIADALADIFSTELYKWLSSNHTRQSYVDQAVNDYCLASQRTPFNLNDALMYGQQAEIEETLFLLIDEIEAQTNES